MSAKDLSPRSARRHRFLLGLPFVATAVEIVATVATISVLAGGGEPDAFVWLPILGILLIPYTTVGALIEDRRPGQVVGRICLTIGLLLGAGGLLFIGGVTLESLPGQPPALTAALMFIGSTILLLVLFLGEPLLVSRFPDGREPGRSGALVDGLLAVAGAVMVPQALLGFGIQIEVLGVDPDDLATVFGLVIFAAFSLGSVLACAGLVRRYIRGTPIARAQIRWFAAAIGTSIVFFVLLVIVYLGFVLVPAIGDQMFPVAAILFLVWILSLLLPPLAIGIAILRHHLYDIDRIISRTIAYGLVSVALLVVFAGVNLGLQSAIGGMTRNDPLVVAASTLSVAALFNPVRLRVQSIVDRRFNRARYDAERTVERFSGRLRDELDLATLTGDLQRTTVAAVEPVTTGVWLRTGGVG